MWHEAMFAREFFKQLAEMDELIADAVEAGGCQHCGGPLYRADYQRKPRGGLFAEAGEAFKRRASLCCGREGCRKRALPPSLRYLGRRVYLEVVVLIATAQAMLARTLRAACEITGVPARTLRRWHAWWTEEFPKQPEWMPMRSLFVPPPPDERELPKVIARAIRRGCRRRAHVESGAGAGVALAGAGDDAVGSGRITFRARGSRDVKSRKRWHLS